MFRFSRYILLVSISAVPFLEAVKAQDAPATLGGTATTLHEFPSGTFLENLLPEEDGSILITSYFDKKLIRLAPDGSISDFADLPLHPVALLATDSGYVLTAHQRPFSDFPGFQESNLIAFLDKSGAVTQITPAVEARFLNGLLELRSGEILAADSASGTIWQVDRTAGTLSPWLRDERLTPDPLKKVFAPGANGLKAKGEWLYISNSSRGVIFRYRFDRTGKLEEWVGGSPVDDFILEENSAVASTHGAQLLRLRPGAAPEILLNTGCDGCTAVANDPKGLGWIILTTGGLLEGAKLPARILLVTPRVSP